VPRPHPLVLPIPRFSPSNSNMLSTSYACQTGGCRPENRIHTRSARKLSRASWQNGNKGVADVAENEGRSESASQLMQRRSRRHTAQDCAFHLHIEQISQLCKHPSWNEWLHGVVLTLSPGSKSHKHIAQATGFPDSKLPSAPSSDQVEAVRPPKTLATSDLATSRSSPPVSVTSLVTR